MFKIVALIAAVAGGAAYGLYAHTDVFQCASTSTAGGSCCKDKTAVAVPPCCAAAEPCCETGDPCCSGSAAVAAKTEACCAAKKACCEVGDVCCDSAKAAAAGAVTLPISVKVKKPSCCANPCAACADGCDVCPICAVDCSACCGAAAAKTAVAGPAAAVAVKSKK